MKVDVVAWRGSREERSWPTALQHGQTLPWTPADPGYYLYADRMKESDVAGETSVTVVGFVDRTNGAVGTLRRAG
ncbi:hypothetical protein [Saccharopolyspora spinosa]|uniref:hypothetical protein n=1 Tax=Saccharopolyspora spinosa TaxID=60894 RepID=UPI000C6F1E60|nr:hypothetical protein [Saccharopolyspora spinosa]